jgi:hypothetical protein
MENEKMDRDAIIEENFKMGLSGEEIKVFKELMARIKEEKRMDSSEWTALEKDLHDRYIQAILNFRDNKS